MVLTGLSTTSKMKTNFIFLIPLTVIIGAEGDEIKKKR
jgi:hypothetical protein